MWRILVNTGNKIKSINISFNFYHFILTIGNQYVMIISDEGGR
nr:MAG TPA: hypothetical protein [Caudoviricetes sp.]